MINTLVDAIVIGAMPVGVSSGNIGSDASEYSPSAPDAMTMGAIDKNDFRPKWSNWGPSVYVFVL